MKITLSAKPAQPTIVLGFPGVGLVGPIVTEFLIEHMKTEQVGVFEYDELPATAAIHKGELVHPMSLHYSKEHNTLIVYTILNVHGAEWKVADEVIKLAKELKAKELICIDGANTIGDDEENVFSYGNKHIEKLGTKPLTESVITGAAGALLLKTDMTTCLFSATNAQTPDSKAAAAVVKVLDKHLRLGVDTKPLYEQAKVFEEKLKSVMTQSKKILSEQERKRMDYLG